MDEEQFPVVYLLMRNDLSTMNDGKAMAQSMHVGGALQNHMDRGTGMGDELEANFMLFKQWKEQTSQGYGTVLTLEVNDTQMRWAVKVARMLGFTLSGFLIDPTYPYIVPTELAKLIPEELDTEPRVYKGKETVLFRSEETCAYIFGDKNDPLLGGDDRKTGILKNFPLLNSLYLSHK